ncbi:MAG: hypothetical protein IKY83_03535 [Proteobacteria bacterium]|nr:hypothetical protein [Pseudomonadota bacterium]
MQLSEFVGFTEEETRLLCEQYHLDFEECKRWYNGYKLDFLDNTLEIYNSQSVVQAMNARKFGDYWTKTGSYDSIRSYISMDFDGIRDDVKTMIAGGSVNVVVDDYLNTMTSFYTKDDVFTYLIHLGYLAYDSITKQCYIPNHEIRSEWIIAIANDSDYAEAIRDEKTNEHTCEIKRFVK